MPEEWQGWYFDRDQLIDNLGNRYHQKDVEGTFYTRQFMEGATGSKRSIYSLKHALHNRLALLDSANITIEIKHHDQLLESMDLKLSQHWKF